MLADVVGHGGLAEVDLVDEAPAVNPEPQRPRAPPAQELAYLVIVERDDVFIVGEGLVEGAAGGVPS
jgi:hypothetical protein